MADVCGERGAGERLLDVEDSGEDTVVVSTVRGGKNLPPTGMMVGLEEEDDDDVVVVVVTGLYNVTDDAVVVTDDDDGGVVVVTVEFCCCCCSGGETEVFPSINISLADGLCWLPPATGVDVLGLSSRESD